MDKKNLYISKLNNDWILDEKIKNRFIKVLNETRSTLILNYIYDYIDKYFAEKDRMIQKWLLDNFEKVDFIFLDIAWIISRINREYEENERTIETENLNIIF